jgi:prepilin-type N-terminal cleavage/methylation domain-containing protein
MKGVTLLELMVVLALLSVILAISGVALASLREPPMSETLSELRAARRHAIQSGVATATHGILFLPDGRAVGSTVDPLTGELRAR